MKRRFQYGLRSLLVLITAFGVWLGCTVNAARRQRETVAAIKAVGGDVLYDWQLAGDWRKKSGRSEPHGPAALRRLLGDEYFQSDKSIAMLKEFKNLRELTIFNCLGDAEVEKLRQALPNCKIEHAFPD